jgi:hypothetical protein
MNQSQVVEELDAVDSVHTCADCSSVGSISLPWLYSYGDNGEIVTSRCPPCADVYEANSIGEDEWDCLYRDGKVSHPFYEAHLLTYEEWDDLLTV